MTVFPLLATGFMIKIVAVVFVICCVALILIVLLQKGRGGGLSAAFGGGAAGGILGSKTGDFLTWVTIVLVGVFLTLAVVLAKFYKPGLTAEFDVSQSAQQQPSPGVEQPTGEVPTVVPDAGADADTDTELPGG